VSVSSRASRAGRSRCSASESYARPPTLSWGTGSSPSIEQWLDEHRPEFVAVERVFSQHNVRTVMGTAQASAVAMLCAARRGIPVALHTPSEVKAAVTGSGRADKAQVGAMVTRLLRLDAPPKPADAADALALAICHIWRAPAQNRLQQAVALHTANAANATKGRTA
jgi:crossover junction endodeoxyribonuclease RuvC